MDSYYNYIKNRFRKWAKFYDLTWIFIGYLRKKTVEFSSISNDKKILDICTGTGDLAIEFAKQGNEVIGIDLSEEMIEIATKKNKFENLKFKVEDATKLSFENESFDVVTSSFGLHEMPKEIMLKTLDEVKRVLKINGQFISIDFYKGKSLFSRIAYPFIKLFECRYYNDFINLDLDKILKDYGFEIEKEEIVLGGVGRMIKLKKYE
ncbi:MAG: methyltransferase domain-containing protein [Parcubacteria group bacterium]|nr:methyltransferase domain-containing protein [Parcubacteria group bacterium]